MRLFSFIVCTVLVLAGAFGFRYWKSLDTNENTLLVEQTPFSSLKIEWNEQHQHIRNADGEVLRGANGEPLVAGKYRFHRLLQNEVLFGSQISEHIPHFLDDFQSLVLGVNPWDTVAVTVALAGYDIRQEPLTYYHRSGPVGAIFYELRSRKNGADAKAAIGVVGLQNGAHACYTLPGQKITFYETDPALTRLTADSDKFFTHVAAARKRGSTIEIRNGNVRDNLKADAGKKFAVLFIDQCETYPTPKDRMNIDAVRAYLDRLTDDGLIALHISSKTLRLELVLARIAAELGLVARVWNDDSDRKPGKTASSWLVLARKHEHLGGLANPIGDLLFAPDSRPAAAKHAMLAINRPLFEGLVADYPELREVGFEKAKYQELNDLVADRAKLEWGLWIDRKQAVVTDATEKVRLSLYARLIGIFGPFGKFQDVMMAMSGHAFRKVESIPGVPLWTDARAEMAPSVLLKP